MSSIGTPPLQPSMTRDDVSTETDEQEITEAFDELEPEDDKDPNGPFATTGKSEVSEQSSNYDGHPDAEDEPDEGENTANTHTANTNTDANTVNTASAGTQTQSCDDTVVVNEDETGFPEFLYAREEDLTSKGSLDGDHEQDSNHQNYSNLPLGIQTIGESASVEVGCQTDPERDSMVKRFMSALPWVQHREPDFAVVNISNPFDDFRAPAQGPRTAQQKTVTTTTKYETRDCCLCNIL